MQEKPNGSPYSSGSWRETVTGAHMPLAKADIGRCVPPSGKLRPTQGMAGCADTYRKELVKDWEP